MAINAGGGRPHYHSFHNVTIQGEGQASEDDIIITKDKQTGNMDIRVVHGNWISRQYTKLSVWYNTDKNHTVKFANTSKLLDELAQAVNTFQQNIASDIKNRINSSQPTRISDVNEIKREADEIKQTSKTLDQVREIFQKTSQRAKIDQWKASINKLSEVYAIVEYLDAVHTTKDPVTYVESIININTNFSSIVNAQIDDKVKEEIQDKAKKVLVTSKQTSEIKELMNNLTDDQYIETASELLKIPTKNTNLRYTSDKETIKKVVESVVDNNKVKEIYLRIQHNNAPLPDFTGTHLEADIARANNMRTVVKYNESADCNFDELANAIKELHDETAAAYQSYLGNCITKFINEGNRLLRDVQPKYPSKREELTAYYDSLNELQAFISTLAKMEHIIIPNRGTVLKLKSELQRNLDECIANAMGPIDKMLSETSRFIDLRMERHKSEIDPAKDKLESETSKLAELQAAIKRLIEENTLQGCEAPDNYDENDKNFLEFLKAMMSNNNEEGVHRLATLANIHLGDSANMDKIRKLATLANIHLGDSDKKNEIRKLAAIENTHSEDDDDKSEIRKLVDLANKLLEDPDIALEILISSGIKDRIHHLLEKSRKSLKGKAADLEQEINTLSSISINQRIKNEQNHLDNLGPLERRADVEKSLLILELEPDTLQNYLKWDIKLLSKSLEDYSDLDKNIDLRKITKSEYQHELEPDIRKTNQRNKTYILLNQALKYKQEIAFKKEQLEKLGTKEFLILRLESIYTTINEYQNTVADIKKTISQSLQVDKRTQEVKQLEGKRKVMQNYRANMLLGNHNIEQLRRIQLWLLDFADFKENLLQTHDQAGS